MYEELLTSMELYYMEEKNLSPVKCPNIDGIYAANFEESWFRVEVLKVSGKLECHNKARHSYSNVLK